MRPGHIHERAEFRLKLQPKLKYNLIGHNCEIIANMRQATVREAWPARDAAAEAGGLAWMPDLRGHPGEIPS